ncbi:XRE family transcriptional regulator [Acidihalobacter aeolianus]|uniref:HTH-type transcriptional regulator MetR n=1 Tax=Acidihalobacter aeolianus TaxID=2792603 RepID=A0A1D8K9K6_9GAMM|nr:LysR family transcriptional regulator [Acidihalobacter aeolianus]AOV17632.1 XRE family transcriptional regulator [Acidihalobacter aeolianus]
MNLELKHLRTLLALHRAGTLAGAAERLHLTQSALSHQIKGLEDDLGGALYVRKSRPLRLTRIGERLLASAVRIAREMDELTRDLSQFADGGGRLHIAIECHSCFAWLTPAMERYREDWPAVEMDLTLAFSFAPLNALAAGDVDLVVTSDPEPRAGLAYRRLFDYAMRLVVAPQHPLAQRTWVNPEDLAGETLITYPVSPQRLDVFTRFLDPAGVAPGAVRTAELSEMILQLVASGRGVSALPDWALRDVPAGRRLVTLPLGREGLICTLHAGMRAADAERAYVRDFVAVTRRLAGGTDDASV